MEFVKIVTAVIHTESLLKKYKLATKEVSGWKLPCSFTVIEVKKSVKYDGKERFGFGKCGYPQGQKKSPPPS